VSKAKLTLNGVPGLEAALRKKVEELRAAATVAVTEEVTLIHADAVLIAPRDSGDLVEKIDKQANGLRGSIKSKSRHAGFVEFGTYKDGAQPYMHPAAERARPRFPKRAASIIRAALGG
jgi:HK97 gp10 family phage protein